MAEYKVIQDIEAEDKLLGWMTLKQFIAFCIACGSLYVIVLAFIGRAPLIVLPIMVPIALVTGLFAAPLSRVQPPEVWIAARVWYLTKPRRRVWNQTGTEQLVTITAPKKENFSSENTLSETEIEGRLTALAHTLDSRGWAVKNVNISVPAIGASNGQPSDRLVSLSNTPREVPGISVSESDDIMDPLNNPVAQRFDQQVKATSQRAHDDAVALMKASLQPINSSSSPESQNAPVQLPNVEPLPNIRMVSQNPPDTLQASNTHPSIEFHGQHKPSPQTTKTVTPEPNPDILELAHNDDFSVATIAKQAQRKADESGEVTIKLR